MLKELDPEGFEEYENSWMSGYLEYSDRHKDMEDDIHFAFDDSSFEEKPFDGVVRNERSQKEIFVDLTNENESFKKAFNKDKASIYEIMTRLEEIVNENDELAMKLKAFENDKDYSFEDDSKKIEPGMVVRYSSEYSKEGERDLLHVIKEERSSAPDGSKMYLIDTLNSGLELGSTEVVADYMLRPTGLTLEDLKEENAERKIDKAPTRKGLSVTIDEEVPSYDREYS